MQAIWNWVRNEWADPSTHAWLVGAGATALAYENGAISAKYAILALVASALGIAIPTGTKKP